jgi:hypothetical protein
MMHGYQDGVSGVFLMISLSSSSFFAIPLFFLFYFLWTLYPYLHRLCFLWMMFAAVLFSKDTIDCFCMGWLGRFAAGLAVPICWVSSCFYSFLFILSIARANCMSVHVLSYTFMVLYHLIHLGPLGNLFNYSQFTACCSTNNRIGMKLHALVGDL